MEHSEHEGHWECTLNAAQEDLYAAATQLERVMSAKGWRSIDEDFALFRLRRAIAKAEGRPSEVEKSPCHL